MEAATNLLGSEGPRSQLHQQQPQQQQQPPQQQSNPKRGRSPKKALSDVSGESTLSSSVDSSTESHIRSALHMRSGVPRKKESIVLGASVMNGSPEDSSTNGQRDSRNRVDRPTDGEARRASTAAAPQNPSPSSIEMNGSSTEHAKSNGSETTGSATTAGSEARRNSSSKDDGDLKDDVEHDNADTEIEESEDEEEEIDGEISRVQGESDNIEEAESIDRRENDRNGYHPYIGKRIRVLQGSKKGLVARIVSVRSRGWWVIEHPDLQDGESKNVHSRRCLLLDEVSDDEMREYYQRRGMRWKGHPAKTRQNQKDRMKQFLEESKSGRSEDAMLVGMTTNGVAYRTLATLENRAEDKDLDAAEIEGNEQIETNSKRQRLPDPDTGPPISLRDVVDSATNIGRLYARQPGDLKERRKDRKRPILPPIRLDLSTEVRNERIPSLDYLPPNTRINIFNRKTGKILSGDHAVAVSALPGVLAAHSEYEPILPPRPQEPDLPRQGRTGTGVSVSATVQPQRKQQESIYKGRLVKVESGQYQGRIGKIVAKLPGGWYTVDGLGSLPMVIDPADLELLPEPKHSNVASQPNEEKVAAKATEDAAEKLFAETHAKLSDEEATKLMEQALILRDRESAIQEQLQSVVTTGKSSQLRQLQKQLDYVKSCREKVEKELLGTKAT